MGGGGLIRVGVGVSKAVPVMGVWWDNGRREVSVSERGEGVGNYFEGY